MASSDQVSPETSPPPTTQGTSADNDGDTPATSTALVHLTPGEKQIANGARSPDEKKRAFLDALARLGTVRAAVEAASVDRHAVYRWRDEDPAFRQGWVDAIEDVADSVEAPMLANARAGQFLPGIAMLKALRPEKFRDGYNPSVHLHKTEFHISFKISGDQDELDSPEAPAELPVEVPVEVQSEDVTARSE
jgi:hypothetical protein